MHRNNAQVLDDTLREAVVRTFAHYGLELIPKGSSRALRVVAHDAVGVIGFTGDQLRGTLVLTTTMSLVEHVCPHGPDSGVPAHDRVRDWMGELTNMTLGKIKVAFSRRGVTLGLSIPVALTGERLHLAAVKPSRTRSWDFSSEEGELRAWLETEFDAALILPLEPDASQDDEPSAGEPVLF